jgi:hypothetical protein
MPLIEEGERGATAATAMHVQEACVVTTTTVLTSRPATEDPAEHRAKRSAAEADFESSDFLSALAATTQRAAGLVVPEVPPMIKGATIRAAQFMPDFASFNYFKTVPVASGKAIGPRVCCLLALHCALFVCSIYSPGAGCWHSRSYLK